MTTTNTNAETIKRAILILTESFDSLNLPEKTRIEHEKTIKVFYIFHNIFLEDANYLKNSIPIQADIANAVIKNAENIINFLS